MAEPRITIRSAQPGDAEAIARIHNQGIEERIATFETREQDRSSALRRLDRSEPVLVAELDGEVVGWAGAGPYEETLPYYDGIAEVTVYVDRGARRCGTGRELLAALAAEAAELGRHKLVAKIFTDNSASIELFEGEGFRRVGIHERHGTLDGGWKDVLVVEKKL
jgi:L-amino acid N-acyltransferase YncA